MLPSLVSPLSRPLYSPFVFLSSYAFLRVLFALNNGLGSIAGYGRYPIFLISCSGDGALLFFFGSGYASEPLKDACVMGVPFSSLCPGPGVRSITPFFHLKVRPFSLSPPFTTGAYFFTSKHCRRPSALFADLHALKPCTDLSHFFLHPLIFCCFPFLFVYPGSGLGYVHPLWRGLMKRLNFTLSKGRPYFLPGLLFYRRLFSDNAQEHA